MRTSVITSALILLLAFSIFAATPKPGPLTIEFGCQCIKLHWGVADSAEFHPDGYIVYKIVDTTGYTWTRINPDLVTDTTYTDFDMPIEAEFNYAVRAHYADGESEMSMGQSKMIYDPSQFDFFIVGNEASGDLNWWYYFKLDSLGLRGIIVDDVLPYCGEMLENLKLLVIVKMGNSWNPMSENPVREIAITDYLDRGGRLYVHDPYQTIGSRLGSEYLGYGFTLCMPYSFLSIHGMPGTFSHDLHYSFSDSLFSSNMEPLHPDNPETYPVLEDDVQCGCVDMAVNRGGYKAVINSQPLNLSTGHDTTGAMLTYFERMMEFFDILSNVDDNTPGQLPDQVSLFAYPNPFNSSVKLRLVNSDLAADQTVSIFDITGRQVRTITMPKQAGEVIWDGRNDRGEGVSSGVYFAKINNISATQIKLTLVK